jgi:ATP phosphoribosyltransferase regulatory subunit HisZ
LLKKKQQQQKTRAITAATEKLYKLLEFTKQEAKATLRFSEVSTVQYYTLCTHDTYKLQIESFWVA